MQGGGHNTADPPRDNASFRRHSARGHSDICPLSAPLSALQMVAGLPEANSTALQETFAGSFMNTRKGIAVRNSAHTEDRLIHSPLNYAESGARVWKAAARCPQNRAQVLNGG